jgi:anti-anti-sigma regulatory factor
VRRSGGDLCIMNVSDRIESILYVTKLNLLFKTYESEEEALKGFSEKSE